MTDYHATCQHGYYRLTCADYDKLWKRARGRCQLCNVRAEDVAKGRLEIDHAPQYGLFAVRGLLCSKCNTYMHSVDSGQKTDERARRYQANAWFVRILHERHDGNVAAGVARLRHPELIIDRDLL